MKVLLDNGIDTKTEYKRRLQVWQDAVASAETAAKSEYINGRLQWVIDSGDDSVRLGKIEVGFIHRAAPCNPPACWAHTARVELICIGGFCFFLC